MNSLDFLKTIMDLGFDYLKDHSDSTISMQGFADFVHAKSSDDLSEIKAAPQNKVQLNTQKDDLGIYLVLLYRYAKEYVKVALRDSPLSTPDEFSFLITLYPNTSRTKTELINEMVLNKTSGMEVIKRLLNKDLIREYEDPEDKRSKRVTLTEAGKRTVLAILPQIAKASVAITGNLSDRELRTINYILNKLEKHHRKAFEAQGITVFEQKMSGA